MPFPRLHGRAAEVAICAFLLAAAASCRRPSVPSPTQPKPAEPEATATQSAETPYVHFEFGYIQKVGRPFLVHVNIQPPNKTDVEVHMEPGNITYSKTVFRLHPRETKLIQATVAETQSGIEFVAGTALYWEARTTKSFGEKENSYLPVRTDYLGQLKPSTTAPLPYDSPTPLFFSVVYPNGKPLGLDLNGQTLELTSPDGSLVRSKSGQPGTEPPSDRLSLPLAAREGESELFQIRPKSRFGGSVHLTAVLKLCDETLTCYDTLTKETFVFVAQPASWLLWGLAIAGGLLHAGYRIARLDPATIRSHVLPICITSAIAGCVAYLIANYDLFGLKFDPNSLRPYVLLGFLMSYFGVDVVADKFSALKSKPASE